MLEYVGIIDCLLINPGVTKECFLEAFKYLKTSKQHGIL